MKIAPDDPRLDAVWRASARYQRPVVIHCGPEPAAEGYGTDVRVFSGADRLRRALGKHPDAIAIVPHLGADQFAQFEALLPEFAGLYLDTAMVIGGYFPIGPDLEMLRRRPDRILYGTDFPNLPYDWKRELTVLKKLGLPQDALDQILWRNASRLFQ
jgi:predicted TIM-barrel fold metal-dependent hydrolase